MRKVGSKHKNWGRVFQKRDQGKAEVQKEDWNIRLKELSKEARREERVLKRQ